MWGRAEEGGRDRAGALHSGRVIVLAIVLASTRFVLTGRRAGGCAWLDDCITGDAFTGTERSGCAGERGEEAAETASAARGHWHECVWAGEEDVVT